MAIKINPVVFTPDAINEIKKIMESQDLGTTPHLRVALKEESIEEDELRFAIGFDEASEEDNIFRVHGISLAIKKEHTKALMGIEVDFVSDPEKSGFLFNRR